jgi:TonB family protein
MSVSSGEEGATTLASPSRRRSVAPAVYAATLIAVASFGFGRAWEPLVATYDTFWRTVAVITAARSAYADSLKSNGEQPRAFSLLPHRITVYPILAWRHNEQGDVILRVLVAANGAVDDVHILRSSGHPQLDAAALIGVGYWFYLPAVRNHRAVASWITVLVRFRIPGEPSRDNGTS